MYKISLLPDEYRLSYTNARKKSVSIIVSFTIIGVLFAAYLIISVVLTGKNTELRIMKERNASLNMQIARLGDIKTLSDEVGVLQRTYKNVVGSPINWEQVIIRIGNRTPPTISLDQMSMKYTDKKGVCIIQGTALNNKTLTEWIEVLNEVPEINEVIINYSILLNDNINGLVEFEVNISVSSPEVDSND